MRQEEYAAMRATIRERGTARMVLLPIIFIGWAAAAVASAAVITLANSTLVPLMVLPTAITTLMPLMVLAAGFEAIFALHVNVERIGRYLQVFHEPEGGWEVVAMGFGQRFPGSGPDPLFSRIFVLAVSINFLPVALGGDVPDIIVVAALHMILVNRIRLARQFSATQRAEDLKRFEALRG
jgi:hypothetical protein